VTCWFRLCEVNLVTNVFEFQRHLSDRLEFKDTQVKSYIALTKDDTNLKDNY